MTTGSNYYFQMLPCSVGSHAIAASWALIKKSMSFSSSGHKKADGLMSIFSLCSSVNFLDGMNSGGCLGKDGRDMRGSDGIRRRIRYSSGRVVWTGCIQFLAFLYLAKV